MPDQTKARNLLFVLSDEHNRKIAGCYGHPFIKTPNIDALAASGTRFDTAYCNSPICVPSRASLATGLHVHDVGCWDNATPYTGDPESWHAHLRGEGVDVISVGKLHYRGGDDYGFREELIPLHVVQGKGDLKGLFRKELAAKTGTGDLARNAGPGISTYCEYDMRIAEVTADWLARRAAGANETPFVLFVSFVMPHFPLIAPQELYDLYEGYTLEELEAGLTAPAHDHPTLNRMRDHLDYDVHFDSESKARALRAYFGMVSKLDELIGDVIGALHANGFADQTDIIYTSDHGDNLGNREMWGKSVMYEDSAGVPMIMSGPDIPSAKVVKTPVSLLDIAPTAAHITLNDAHAGRYPGTSLIDIAQSPPLDRSVLSQYHATGSDTGQFMIRKGRWKYIVYVGTYPQLFDLAADPDEHIDLGQSDSYADIRAILDAELRSYCDPEAVNTRVFADQLAVIEANGGKEGISSSADIPFTPAPA